MLTALGTVLSVPLARAAQPKCVVVNVGSNQSYGSLQEAIEAASAGDTLRVKGTCEGAGISKSLTIEGRGRATLTGDSAVGDGLMATITGIRGREVFTGYGAQLTINDSTITGILNYDGEVTLNHSTVTGNSGVGITTGESTFTLNDSTVSGNSFSGIRASDSTVTLNHSTVSGNGGGINAYFTGITLNDSTVSRNTAAREGGGISGQVFDVTLNDSTITGNTASGDGGGISTSNEWDRVILNGSSAVSRNTAAGDGGGIYDVGVVTLNSSSSVSRNTASAHGGGIYLAKAYPQPYSPLGEVHYGPDWSGTVSRNIPDNIFSE
jgi:hypothetical protein